MTNIIEKYGALGLQLVVLLIAFAAGYARLATSQDYLSEKIAGMETKYVLVAANDQQIRRLEAELQHLTQAVNELKEELRKRR